jgi:hypothetical protein
MSSSKTVSFRIVDARLSSNGAVVILGKVTNENKEYYSGDTTNGTATFVFGGISDDPTRNAQQAARLKNIMRACNVATKARLVSLLKKPGNTITHDAFHGVAGEAFIDQAGTQRIYAKTGWNLLNPTINFSDAVSEAIDTTLSNVEEAMQLQLAKDEMAGYTPAAATKVVAPIEDDFRIDNTPDTNDGVEEETETTEKEPKVTKKKADKVEA